MTHKLQSSYWGLMSHFDPSAVGNLKRHFNIWFVQCKQKCTNQMFLIYFVSFNKCPYKKSARYTMFCNEKLAINMFSLFKLWHCFWISWCKQFSPTSTEKFCKENHPYSFFREPWHNTVIVNQIWNVTKMIWRCKLTLWNPWTPSHALVCEMLGS